MGSSADDESFRAFVRAHESSLFRMAFLLTGDRGHAEDLVQTAFLRTYTRWDRLYGDQPLAYARRVIANANIDRWRRDRGRERLTDVPPEGVSVDAAHGLVERDAVVRALATLTDRERRVVVLRFLLDLSQAETAELLGVPEGTVKSATNRALTRLRNDGALRAEVTS